MRPFRFAAPTTLNDAISAMAEAAKNGGGRALVGGTDLLAQLKERRRTAGLVVDVKRVPEMNRLEYVEGEGLHVGSAVSCARVYEDEGVVRRYPAVVDGARLIGAVQIQNRASLGGNVCNAAPSGDTIPGLLVHEANAVVAGPKGVRQIELKDFFAGPGRTVMEPDEMLVELILPPPPADSSSHYMRFIPREEMDIAVAGAASLVAVDRNGVATRARFALASVAPTPLRATEAEQYLEGKPVTDEHVDRAAELAVNAARPISDVRGTVEYRKELVRVLTHRTLKWALSDLGR